MKVLADSQSVINAAVLSTSLALAAGSTGVGIAIGVSVAQNYIGKSGSTGATLPGTGVTTAYISNSTVTASDDLIVKATSDKAINALVFAGAGAVSVGAVGVSVSGSGVYAENIIGGATEANIAIGNQLVQGGTVTVQAMDTSRIEAIAAAVSLSLALGNIGVAVSLAGAVAENAIDTTIKASVTEVAAASTGSLVATSGNVLIDAKDDATIRVISAAAAIALVEAVSLQVWLFQAQVRWHSTGSPTKYLPKSSARRSMRPLPQHWSLLATTCKRPLAQEARFLTIAVFCCQPLQMPIPSRVML
ncbi:hypothetical protein QTO30_13535 [Yoonia sp. GPGPB17]|uniref:hypothetical protein n=1 Tax=Yoonia sp. GPGPB17 TaxID=3026147 RepID=UPI0030C31504